MKFNVTTGFLALAAMFGITYAAPISTSEISDMASQGYRLLDLAEGVPPVWKTEDEKLDLLRAGVKFVRDLSTTHWLAPADIQYIVRCYRGL